VRFLRNPDTGRFRGFKLAARIAGRAFALYFIGGNASSFVIARSNVPNSTVFSALFVGSFIIPQRSA
jgi:hypothetical protein